jgi:3-oxoacyl-[acyl-carrier protein] reductase
MDLGIKGKTALVMGGSRGIGFGIAQRLSREGCGVAIVARREGPLNDAVAQIRAAGGEAIGIAADIANYHHYDSILDKTRAALGEPDIAVYSPPSPPSGAILDLTEEELAASYSELCLCFLRLVRLCLPHMKAQRWGRFLTVGSATTKSPLRGQLGAFHYALANINRMAAVRLSKQISDEVVRFGITVNTLGIGGIDTETSRNFFAERAREIGISYEDFVAGVKQQTPAGRIGTVEESADLAAFLCSALASFTTGETILCDGGQFNAAM